MKTHLVIGLGRFGQHVTQKLCALGSEVFAVDKDEECVNKVLPFAVKAQIGDATNEQFIESLAPASFDTCFVAIGDDFQSSLEVTSLLKDYGARHVVARASRAVHEKFLLRCGADEVIYPEKETAIRTAVKYNSDSVFDYIELTPEFSIYEIEPPESWLGKTILDLNVRTNYHMYILATKKDGVMSPLPQPDYVFRADETLVVMGSDSSVQKLLR